jgi:hypothetical protein
MARFSLNYDHRFIDGTAAALFLRDLSDLLADPHNGGLGEKWADGICRHFIDSWGYCNPRRCAHDLF